MKKTHHLWSTLEKQELVRLNALGKTKREIRNILFPNESVTVRAVQKMTEVLKKNPELINRESVVNKTTSTVTRTRNYKKRRKPLHYWPVSEKKAIQELLQQGKNSRQIKRELYKSDKTVTPRSLYGIIYRLKNEPNWVNEHPQTNTPGNPNYNPVKKTEIAVTKNSRSYNKPIHFWTPEEKLLLQKNADKTAKWIKKNIFPSDKTINNKSIAMQLYYLKKGIVYNKQSNKELRGHFTPVSERFQLDNIHAEFSDFKKSVHDFTLTLNSLIDDDSPFNTQQQERIRSVINEQSLIAIQEKQVELLKKLPVTV